MKNFIEIYDDALPADICDYLIAIFDRENSMSPTAVGTSRGNLVGNAGVDQVRTLIDPSKGDTIYVSALDLTLDPQNYLYDSVIGELDYILHEYIFDYNKKYHVWSSELNMDLVPEEHRKQIEENGNNPEYLSDYIYRHGNHVIKKYNHPDDGYYAWHTDWGPLQTFIGRVLATQFYLNDVDEGGETEFYHQEIKVKPKKGRLVIWPVGFTHTHRGNNPISNDKYVVSSWYTQRNILK